MNNYISSLNIETFRGIKNLNIDNIGSVNILVGGNNSGKTSILESIQLFCNPNEYDLIIISGQRDHLTPRKVLNRLENLKFMFDAYSSFTDNNNYTIKISAKIENTNSTLTINGKFLEELLDISSIKNNKIDNEEEYDTQEDVLTFNGCINHTIKQINSNFEINKYSKINNLKKEIPIKNIKMLSTIDHIVNDPIKELVKNSEYKNLAIKMLKNFDQTIEDIRYIKTDSVSDVIPIIENSDGKYIPISLYGDGMKKSITILNAIISAKDGILLIDEFETALHTTIMKSVFKFMLDVANELKVQLFLTTHSIEAVDNLLESSRSLEDVRIIRLKKTEEKMFAKVTVGNIALENRKEYELELRI